MPRRMATPREIRNSVGGNGLMSKRQSHFSHRRGRQSRAGSDTATAKERGACDIWGRPLADDETPDEQAARLLMSLNWICDLLDHISGDPDDADRVRSMCQEFIGRLTASCRAPELRKGLADAASHIGANRYREASAVLRSLAV